jgi:formylmethanofuran dehydrogenase subunit D
LETHILNFNEDDFDDLDLKKGDKIKVIGTIQTTGKT